MACSFTWDSLKNHPRLRSLTQSMRTGWDSFLRYGNEAQQDQSRPEDYQGNPEFGEEQAAVKIQASFRGFKARQQVDTMKGQESAKGAKNEPVPAETEELDIDLNDPDLSKAATKIQASFRGHKVRKEVKPLDQNSAKEAAAAALKEAEEEEVLDIDLTDPDLEKAATKIQATFRGYHTRAKTDKP